MGIIMSALAAAGDEGVKSVDANIKQQMIADQDERRSALETAKAKALVDYQKQAQLDAENQKRQGIQDRVGAARTGLVDKAIGDKYAPSDAAVADAAAGKTAAPLTAAQLDAINQSKTSDKAALANDPHTYIEAAMATGDIDPKEVATLVQQADQMKRMEASQKAQFEHSDKSQREQFAHSEALARQAQAHADAMQTRLLESRSDEKQKDRDLKAKMQLPPADITSEEKANWLHTYVSNGGQMPRSAPLYVRNSIGTWAAQSGIGPDDIKRGTAQQKMDLAASVTAGHRQGAMAGVEAAMPLLADNAIATSAKLDKGDFVPLNKLMMLGEDSISNPDLAAFKVAHQALASEYQQVIARGGTNVTALKEAMHVLEGAKSQAAYVAAVNQVKNEVAINVAAMKTVRANAGGDHTAAPTNSIPSPFTNNSSGKVLTYDPATGTFH